MFQDVTYETILGRMVDRVNLWARERGLSLDTREGSLIRTAMSPAAAEMLQMYLSLDEVLNESFADTATRDFLIRRAAERGIAPYGATRATRKGEFTPLNLEIPIGARFSLGKLNYVVTSKIQDGVYRMECETAGEAGNAESGALIPIDYVDGLQTATLTDVLIPAEDDESAEHLRQRYYDSLDSQAFGGNVADYKEKTLALDGVGGVKVYPAWDGGGTVKLVILSSQFRKPTPTLVDMVQTAIDPTGNQGAGLGLAPIGHVVTVAGADEAAVDVTTRVTFEQGWDWGSTLPYMQEAIDRYFASLAEGWQDSNAIVVRISQIETRLLGLTGILDVRDTTLNGEAENLEIAPDGIPTRGVLASG
jgi:uncharacterized phage protein gp47/JayE